MQEWTIAELGQKMSSGWRVKCAVRRIFYQRRIYPFDVSDRCYRSACRFFLAKGKILYFTTETQRAQRFKGS